jgi:hypothetical protein
MTIRELLDRAKREEYVTVMQLAVLTQQHPQTLWRACRAGRVPGVVRFGRSIRIHRKTALATYRLCADDLDSIRL